LLRVVSFRKAILAGAAGALAWEVSVRILALVGLPIFDMARELGTLAVPHGGMAQWWPVGMAAHALSGAGWALFYAYFFWARYRWPPPMQGLVFSAFPATLAIVIVVPQLRVMHLDGPVADIDWRTFAFALSASEIARLLIAHAF
jgi:hypothetical protein